MTTKRHVKELCEAADLYDHRGIACVPTGGGLPCCPGRVPFNAIRLRTCGTACFRITLPKHPVTAEYKHYI
ncbi:hypothetical protein CEXT_775941 [Caerostris extrusa]|uniref:Uncharacterized protein n=1 Tax=Caerostris extrusa TaxID=172846 RepID=A0AAV4UQ60_CAEEX|nr:hypothetical protein CEXT_775941 [Caerostris extrusa]